ncbi:DUF1697 domain-containing protein [Microbacterium sulfonylureivorans]|uniref:DUF1697 domain-containing protein n=1 Tax=Microbacterium sulfonylureivorans TaxID=2486854 RepID=UPI0013E08D55|nr:DUF1697 domain-containing protein [Microbacterium sulfonylureivorans]
MDSVAFLRNVNQGQRGQPATHDIVAAFERAGAHDVRPFQSNGTVLFTAVDPDAVAESARGHLALDCGIDTVVFVRPLTFVAQVVERHADASSFTRRELTLFDVDTLIADDRAAGAQAMRRRCAVVEHGAGWAVVENDADRQSNGTPTIEAALGTPATSRGLPTLLRLIDRHGL